MTRKILGHNISGGDISKGSAQGLSTLDKESIGLARAEVKRNFSGTFTKVLRIWYTIHAPGASMEVAELRHEVSRLKAILDDAGIPY